MAENTQTPVTPAPNTPSGLTAADVEALISKATAPLLKQLETALADQKVLADTLAKLPPAAQSQAEVVAQVKAELAKEQQAAAKTAETEAARKAAIDAVVAEKGKDLPPDLVKLALNGAADAAAATAALDALGKSVGEVRKAAVPNVGGAAGGAVPAAASAFVASGNMSENMAKVAAAIQAGK